MYIYQLIKETDVRRSSSSRGCSPPARRWTTSATRRDKEITFVLPVYYREGITKAPSDKSFSVEFCYGRPLLPGATSIHPVSITRFPSFRTQTLENLSHYL